MAEDVCETEASHFGTQSEVHVFVTVFWHFCHRGFSGQSLQPKSVSGEFEDSARLRGLRLSQDERRIIASTLQAFCYDMLGQRVRSNGLVVKF